MSMQDYEKAVKLINANSDKAYFCLPRPKEIIEAAEKKLGMTFPPTYKRFLLEYGCGNFDSQEIYGITDGEFDNSGVPDAIWLTIQERKEHACPNSLIFIYSDGCGYLYALDASQQNELREYPVVIIPCGYYDLPKFHIAYEDFGAFFYDTIKMILEIIAEEEAES